MKSVLFLLLIQCYSTLSLSTKFCPLDRGRPFLVLVQNFDARGLALGKIKLISLLCMTLVSSLEIDMWKYKEKRVMLLVTCYYLLLATSCFPGYMKHIIIIIIIIIIIHVLHRQCVRLIVIILVVSLSLYSSTHYFT